MAKKEPIVTKKNEISAITYKSFINSLKEKVRASQIKATLSINKELIILYWEIGKEIIETQK